MTKSAAIEGEILKPGEPLPAGLPLLPGRPASLKTASGVLREMAAVYRASRRGALDLQAACKLTFILQSMGRLHETVELERRVAALENRR